LLDKAVSIYRNSSDVEGLILALIRRANTLRFLGDYSISLIDIDTSLRLAESDPSFQSHYAEALRIRGLNQYRLGDSQQAVESMEQSLSLYSAINENARIPIVLMETGMVHQSVGNINSARNSYQKALALKQAESDLYTQAEILNNLSVLYHQIGEYELASETFETGLACARKSRNRRAESLILSGLGDLYRDVDEYDLASQAYHQAELATGDLVGFIKNYLIVARGYLELTQGNLEDVNYILKAYRKFFRTSNSAYERGLWLLLEGRYFLLRNNPKKAISLFKASRDLFLQDGRDLEEHWSIIWLSAALCQSGEKERAISVFQEIIPDNLTIDHALLITIHQAAHWLSIMQNDPVFGRRLHWILDKVMQFRNRLPLIRRNLRRHANFIQIPTARLSIRAFGNPEVSMDGKIIQMSDWRTQSVRDLFLFFVQKQEAVTKEQVGAVLWPDISNSQLLKARFKNEIYRLRRAVGREVIIFDDEYYCFNHGMDYEYDVEAFDSYVSRAKNNTNKNSRIEHLQKAVDLVRGSYLADVDADWAVLERERLKQSYETALEELAYLYLDTGQLDNSLLICQLALKWNRFQEAIYQIEMQAHAILGDRPSVVRMYQACKVAMEQLGIPMSEETEQIYRELTG
jgi:two-component SAPR family response regulator/Flp pilus assembly protein TadD